MDFLLENNCNILEPRKGIYKYYYTFLINTDVPVQMVYIHVFGYEMVYIKLVMKGSSEKTIGFPCLQFQSFLFGVGTADIIIFHKHTF